MQSILPISCGLDIHKDTIEACILIDRGYVEPEIIRNSFTTLRGDLAKLRDWLVSNGCNHVAMESTGVYWKPVYEILEEIEGINLCLVNAYHMRNLPGRKTDVKDAEWIASLFMCGLLNKSFVPEKGIRDLREYTRFYKKLEQEKTRQVNRIEKFLQTHGFKLSSVLSSIVGVSSRRVLEILCEKGQVSVFEVQMCLERGVKRSADEIAYAINGKLSAVSRALLRELLDTLYAHEKQLKSLYSRMEIVSAPYAPAIALLDSIPGIDILAANYVIAEIGVDMLQFAKAGNIVSWVGLSPKNDMSAGTIKSKKLKKGNNYAKSVLVQCAWATIKVRNTRLSNWYWRNVGRLGKKKAIVAVARKLLRYIYAILSTGEVYNRQLDVADTIKNKALKLESAKKHISTLESKNAKPSVKIVAEDDSTIGADKDDKPPVIPSKKSKGGQKSPNSIPQKAIAPEVPKKRGRPRKNLTSA